MEVVMSHQGMTGANEEELAALKASFDREAGRLQEITATLRNQLGNTTWYGDSAQRFREAWAEDYERVLGRVAEALIEAGMEVERYRQWLTSTPPR
jgi:uncharacterized protein YukE